MTLQDKLADAFLHEARPGDVLAPLPFQILMQGTLMGAIAPLFRRHREFRMELARSLRPPMLPAALSL